MKQISYKKGFTLIETLVYLGLFTILLGGAVVSAYALFESNNRNQTAIMMEQEGNFLISKIGWALSGVEAINIPNVNGSASELSITTASPLIGSLDFKMDAQNNLQLSSGGITEPLNNSNTSVSNLLFTYGSQGGVEWITTSLTLSARTADGQIMTKEFESTKYIRK